MRENDIITICGKPFAIVKYVAIADCKQTVAIRDEAHNGAIARASVRKPRGHKTLGTVTIYSDGQITPLFEV